MPERELLVRIVGDDRSLQQAFARSSRSAQQFESRTATVGRNLKAGFAAAGVGIGATAGIAFARNAIDAASDLNEEITKSQKVFGDSADSISEWSKTTASAIGIARTEALQASGIFGNLFRTVDIGTDTSAEMSRRLVELAADLASFNNADISDVLQAIRSGLIGEAEPLRRYGVLLSEARVQQLAMANSGKSSARELTNQEKALARYQIILEDTVPAQGDFADTMDGLANQQRIAAAEAQELATSIGQVLLPVEQVALIATIGLVGGINDLIDAMGSARTRLRDSHFADGWNDAMDNAAQHAGDFLERLRDGIPFLIEFRDKVRGAFAEDPGDPTAGGDTGPQRAAGGRAAARSRAIERDRQQAQQELTEARKRFAAFIKGLDLKLKRAGLTPTLDDDIAVMREIERAIERRIAVEGRTYDLVNALTDIQIRIANAQRTQAAQQAQAQKEARDNARDAAENARDRARAEREAAATRKQEQQFLALGLTAEGEQRVPGIAALRRRGRNLLEEIAGTEFDTARNRKRIGAVLSQQFKDAGREVRQAILAMFNEISAALDQGSKRTQTHTKFRVANTSQILGGLGLSEREQQELRRRLSKLGPGGTLSGDRGPGGAFGLNVGGGGNVVVTGPVTVVSNDPDEFGRKLERKTRRNGGARTGPFAGRK